MGGPVDELAADAAFCMGAFTADTGWYRSHARELISLPNSISLPSTAETVVLEFEPAANAAAAD